MPLACNDFKTSEDDPNACVTCGYDIEHHVPKNYGFQKPICHVDENGNRDEVK